MRRRRSRETEGLLLDDPLWFKDAIIYEIPVRAFCDAKGDGCGDLLGLVQKLDYLQDLGVTALWLLPFYPSPLRDGGYDIADYMSVNAAHGTVRDFRRLLTEAHRRGIRVITELVINHTSVEHPWFQRARRAAPGSKQRDFYVWSDRADKYQDARIIFQDFERSNWTWDSLANAYYWHRFYSHQPDLNFDNPEVKKALFKVLDFWMNMGVDGMRLDAVPYLFEREGTNCENLPETHAFLKELRAYIDGRHPNRMLLAEANQWPEDAAAYFGDGDECHMNFHFPLMPRMFMAVQLESSFPVVDILQQTPEIPETCQWAVFLRNHDELTLEMVTDEDRDYMYRVYAEDPQARLNLGIRHRLAPLLKLRSKVELMNVLLFSMPGTPVLYYGDEIGMGDNIYLGDRDGVRTPMQWSSDRNAGFSRSNPQRLYLPVIIDPEYHYESVNVEAQHNNSTSLLWWMRHLIGLRKRHPVLGRGGIELLQPENGKVLAYFRFDETTRILVVANLSRFSQYVELDLSRFAGMVPLELFGQNDFPPIGELPYLLTMGPYGFYWFELRSPDEDTSGHDGLRKLPQLRCASSWTQLLSGRSRQGLEKALLQWVRPRRWFRGKARRVKQLSLLDSIPLDVPEDHGARLTLFRVEYTEGPAETYVVALACAVEQAMVDVEQTALHELIARVRIGSRAEGAVDGVIYEAMHTAAVAGALLSMMRRRRVHKGSGGQIAAAPGRALRELDDSGALVASVSPADQSNTNVIFSDRFLLKILRRIEEGTHPEVELSRYLSERAAFSHVPRFAGALEYRAPKRPGTTLAILHELMPSSGDAWTLTLDSLGRYLERVLAREREQAVPAYQGTPTSLSRQAVPQQMEALIGPYLPLARLLGQRTAELHLALAHDREDSSFAPEPLSLLYQRSLYQSARSRLIRTFDLLSKMMRSLDGEGAELARQVLRRRSEIDARLKRIHAHKIVAARIRCHGDLHLGQVLHTSRDFVFIDFEGEPARALGERRFKSSPLRDVAGMLRSFDYASVSALREGTIRTEDVPLLSPWARAWSAWVSAAWLAAWRDAAAGAPFVSESLEDLEILLEFYLIDKCLYEIGYELNNRPSWLPVPLQGLLDLVGGD